MSTTVTDYSQSGEQAAILKACGETVGRYLDIGAYHPTTFSNTRALYERGWSGVMVEPSPLPFEALLREYGNDDRVTLICAAVDVSDEGLVKLYATQDALSTTNEQWYGELNKRAGYRGGFYGSFFVPTVSIDRLMDFGPFDFVNIDTEGSSEALAWEVLWDMKPLPKCICVETIHVNLDGYDIAFENDTNRVYVKR